MNYPTRWTIETLVTLMNACHCGGIKGGTGSTTKVGGRGNTLPKECGRSKRRNDAGTAAGYQWCQ